MALKMCIIRALVLLCLGIITSCRSDSTLKSFQLTFPSVNHKSYARLQNTISSPLHEFTLCYWVRPRHYSISAPVFSYATAQYDNELTSTIYKHLYHVYKQRITSHSNASIPLDEWSHLCTTWSKGVFKMFHNGTEMAHVLVGGTEAHPVSPGGIVILGQEQDSLGGSFATGECLSGDVSEVHLWDHLLCPEQISGLSQCWETNLEGNVISWRQSSFALNGPVVLSPVTLCSESEA